MTKPKAEIASRLPIRRGLSEAEAALYVGLGATKFRELVAAGTMPRPRIIGDRKVWDVFDLDAAFSSLPVEAPANTIEEAGKNPWH